MRHVVVGLAAVASTVTAAAPPAVATDWCLPGLAGLDEDMCYVLPPLAEGKPRRLLIYLHGIVPPLPTSPQKEAVEHAVLGAAEHAGAPFERTYLAGSSNGAYFLTALALRGDCDAFGFPIDGFGAMSGGASGGRSPTGTPHPLYIGFGTYDDEVKKGARDLGALATAARWPVKLTEHPFGHGAKQVYLDEAFEFWDSQ